MGGWGGVVEEGSQMDSVHTHTQTHTHTDAEQNTHLSITSALRLTASHRAVRACVCVVCVHVCVSVTRRQPNKAKQ